MAKSAKDKGLVEAKSNEVAIVDPDGLFDLSENMEGVKPEIPKIKIVHQGQQFKMADNSKTDTFEGIILDMNNTRAWWEEDYDSSGGGSFPDCFSNDGVRPAENCEAPKHTSCASCPLGQYDEDIKKTPCKRSKQLHVLFAGEMLPHRILLPPSNIKSADNYISSLTSKRIPFQLVRTKMWLKECHNKKGTEYSEIQFENVGVLESDAEKAAIKEAYMSMKPIMRVGAESNHE